MSADEKQKRFMKIPAVDRLLTEPKIDEALDVHPRELVLRALNLVLGELRDAISGDRIQKDEELEPSNVAIRVIEKLEEVSRPSLRPVINATGVIVHTNLGRSILAEKVLKKFRRSLTLPCC